MNKKRIAMISLHTCPLAAEEGKETGGMNIYVLETSKSLSKMGLKIDVFTRSQDSSQPKIVQINPNFRVIHLPAGPEAPMNKKEVIKYVPEFATNFQKFVKEHQFKYDLFHCHYYLSGLAALLIQEKFPKKIPLVTNFHTLALMKNLVARTDDEREDSSRIDAENLLVEKSNKIITQSEIDQAYLEYLYDCPKEKISVIIPGVNRKLFKPIDKREAKRKIKANVNHRIILFVGRIEPLKGIDVLMYALKILRAKNPKLSPCLWIVGGDISQDLKERSLELKKLEKLRQDLNLSNAVKFVGQKKQKELPYYYASSEMVVFPSHYESFGLAALEAMACGIPVIVTDVSGVSALLDEKHKSLITSSNNPLLLASQIEKLMRNEKDHYRISQEILSKTKDFSWEKCAESIRNIYESF